ncbi:MAG: ANTAR domain-containing protein [Erysipelotrichaceae bacterium]|jgi:AmiR/NasT family two-component response regulator|nr:ANTAR domain-containing protein [Erysipelotrichaceae bacterium]
MARILILSRSQDSLLLMKNFLLAHQESDIHVFQDPFGAKAFVKHHYFDIILYDYPFLNERHELSFLISLAENSSAFVITAAARSAYETICRKTEHFGMFTIIKPIHSDLLYQLINFAKAAAGRYSAYEKKQERLLDKIKEIKLVDRAKCLLIEHELLSEQEAHKKIERTAMNSRMTKYEIAQKIINAYEEG